MIKKGIIRIINIGVLILLFSVGVQAQTYIRGSVSLACDHDLGQGDHDEHADRLPFANVYWAGGTTGVNTDEYGEFKIPVPTGYNLLLVASFVGCINDTIEVSRNNKRVDFVLKQSVNLPEVVISESLDGSYISRIRPIKTEIISEAGLQKLACCNLSESFENSATVDVGYSDAVTGAKKIRMLGLSGIYSQILTENVPSFRGLASNYGLSYIPGNWMQSIQVSKGASSVINGYESTTGQINIEYKKPEHTQEKLFVNVFANDEARFETNVNAVFKISERVSTMLLTHGSFNQWKIDHDHDGFLDAPVGWQVNAANRWTFDSKKGGHTQLLVNYLQEERQGGQMAFYDPPENSTGDFYGTRIRSQRLYGFLKSGIRFNKPYQSLGIIASGTWHDQRSEFGKRTYDGIQKSAYANIIYQTIIVNSNHQISSGGSFMLDDYDEKITDSSFRRSEYVAGAFTEYTYSYIDKFQMILGLRADYHNLFDLLITPRIHLKWNIDPLTVLRASAGRAYRSPSMIAENSSLLASNRTLVSRGEPQIEEAWNYGLNITRDFNIDENRKISLSADFYRTDFVNMLVIDLDESAQRVVFSYLKGNSRANSFQFDFSIQPIKRMDISLAFRYNDSKTMFNGVLRETPFMGKYKGLMTMSYATRFEKWKFDLTLQYNGRSRLPYTGDNPEPYVRSDYSKEYYMVHAQVTKKWRRIDLYAGAENILNFRQRDPIVSAEDPSTPWFDASMIWGPLMGRTIYAGLRWKIPK